MVVCFSQIIGEEEKTGTNSVKQIQRTENKEQSTENREMTERLMDRDQQRLMNLKRLRETERPRDRETERD